jgi:hypothetical protein
LESPKERSSSKRTSKTLRKDQHHEEEHTWKIWKILKGKEHHWERTIMNATRTPSNFDPP